MLGIFDFMEPTMVFVPLPLFATLLLTLALVRFAMTRDMKMRAHHLFAGLVALYAVQSFLTVLRWGYDIGGVAPLAGVIAPLLPILAHLAFTSLSERLAKRHLWPLCIILVIWLCLLYIPQAADVLILATYLGFGISLIWRAWQGSDRVARSPLYEAKRIVIAMGLTGLTLVASGLTDIYILVDFIRHEGRHIGLVVTFVQTAFVLLIGLAATFGHASGDEEHPEEATPPVTEATLIEDSDIVGRLEALFENERLHTDEDLSLRRLARRLQLPERRLSNAVNRSRDLSVSQFVNEARIKEACLLLETTKSTVLEVSLAVGFATKSNFNREFRRVTGTTPSLWRGA